MRQISKEAYEDPEMVRNAPHNSTIHNIPMPVVFDVDEAATTWRKYKRIKGIE